MARLLMFVGLAALLAVSFAPAAFADPAACITYNQTVVLDGPAQKNCSRCQWQCLTDFWCTSASFAGTVYAKADLPFLNCGDLPPPLGDTYFTDIKNGTIKGLAVLFNGETIIDVQEQSCEETAHQCYYWASCTSFTFNYDFTVTKDGTNAMLKACPATPYNSPIIVKPDGNARKLL
jgi:hypothetical protein